jgi:hypothetical protein
MRTKTPTREMYMRTLTLLRAAISRDQYKYAPGGREKRRARAISSLPRLNSINKGDQRSE